MKSEENRGNLDPPCQELLSESEDDDFSGEEENCDYLHPGFKKIQRRRNRGQKQVLFCGPSNSSVDVAASKLMVAQLISSCFLLTNLYIVD